MVQTLTRAATYADLEAVPPHLVAEILFGELVTHPRPTFGHGAAMSGMGVLVGGPFQFGQGGPGGWVFVDEPELHLGPHVVVPDIAGWRRERVTWTGRAPHVDVAPDWICEGLSPSTEKRDKGVKRHIYGAYGVAHLWHLDPRIKSLETFERRGEAWLLTHTFIDADEVRAAPFADIAFSLGLLWPFDQTPVDQTPSPP